MARITKIFKSNGLPWISRSRHEFIFETMGRILVAYIVFHGTLGTSQEAQESSNDEPLTEESLAQVKTAENNPNNEDGKSKGSELSDEQADDAEQIRVASATHIRRFHEVLDELMAEFGYDIKLGQIKGLANLSVRRIRVSNAIPRTYEDYMSTLIAERIHDNSQIKIISCVPCNTRTSSLIEGKLLITSPATNMAKLESAATQLGINNFLDAVLVYHTTHMVLAIDIFNAQTKELVWAKTYNSETIKSRYQKLAIDYSQVAKSRPGEDYVPEYRFMFGLGGASIPNVSGASEDKQMLTAQIRGTEKFNNRRDEFGMMLSLLKTAKSGQSDYPSQQPVTTVAAPTEVSTDDPKPKAFPQAFGIYGVYSHLVLGSVESYNQIRHGGTFALGGLLASGYIAPALRGGWDIYLGRRFVSGFGLNYIGNSSVLIKGKSVATNGGIGGDIILSLTF